jgi:integrase
MARPRKPHVRVPLPTNVHRTVSRGHEYFTYQEGRNTRTPGPRIKLPHIADPEFWPAYRAIARMEEPKPANGTFAALGAAYLDSTEWRDDLSDKTRVEWRRYVDRILTKWGDLQVSRLEPKHVVKLRDRFSDTPASADNLLRCLSAMISWGVLRGWRADNPCLIVPKLARSKPYPPWPWECIETVRQRGPQELWWATALALYSGQRQGDVLRMKWSDIREGYMTVVQEKTDKPLQVLIHRDLLRVLNVIPRRSIFILTSSMRAPWTADGFRTSWGRMTKRLSLDEQRLVFHGLRKSAVVMLLESGCSDAEVSAITGQSRKMVEHYSLQVNQKKLGASAILKWENAG